MSVAAEPGGRPCAGSGAVSPRDPAHLSWAEFAGLLDPLAAQVPGDGLPEVIVGILRGGMVPAVMLAHRWGLRCVRGLDVIHTATDAVDAAKTPAPLVRDTGGLGGVAGADVLLVDDVAGTGATIAAARDVVAECGAARVRTLVCVLNQANWPPDADEPATVISYIGRRQRGWVVFPWEIP